MEALARADRLRELQARNAERVAAVGLDRTGLLAAIQASYKRDRRLSAMCRVSLLAAHSQQGLHAGCTYAGFLRHAEQSRCCDRPGFRIQEVSGVDVATVWLAQSRARAQL